MLIYIYTVLCNSGNWYFFYSFNQDYVIDSLVQCNLAAMLFVYWTS